MLNVNDADIINQVAKLQKDLQTEPFKIVVHTKNADIARRIETAQANQPKINTWVVLDNPDQQQGINQSTSRIRDYRALLQPQPDQKKNVDSGTVTNTTPDPAPTTPYRAIRRP